MRTTGSTGLRTIPPDTVDVWRVRLDEKKGSGDGGKNSILSEDERRRAGRFHDPVDAARFASGRAALREVLASYTGRGAAEIAIEQGGNGKPRLADPQLGWLNFNVSHSRDVALIAVVAQRRVGIDVEAVAVEIDWPALVETVLSPDERAEWNRLNSRERTAAFFAAWVFKEAYVKAIGEGLVRPLPSITAGWSRTERFTSVRDSGYPEDGSAFRLYPVESPVGFLAAVAVEGGPVAIRCDDWPATA